MDIKQKLLALAIAIVLVAFVSVGIDTFYKGPENPCNKIYESRPKISNCELLREPEKTNCFREQQLFYDNQSIESQKCFNEFNPI